MHVPEHGRGETADNEEHADEEILIDYRARAAGKTNQEGQTAKVIVHECDGRAMNCDLASGRAHGDAHIAGSESWGVVHTVSHHGDTIALRLHFPHEFNFVLWQ